MRAVRKAVRAATMTFAAISMRRCFFMVCGLWYVLNVTMLCVTMLCSLTLIVGDALLFHGLWIVVCP